MPLCQARLPQLTAGDKARRSRWRVVNRIAARTWTDRLRRLDEAGGRVRCNEARSKQRATEKNASEE